jgi:hypothetical protein
MVLDVLVIAMWIATAARIVPMGLTIGAMLALVCWNVYVVYFDKPKVFAPRQ